MRYTISDHHFGHGNIIEYCSRPFSNVNDMNAQMVTRWNDTVDEDDTVIYLGDVRHHPDPHTIGSWFDRLNGEILLVRGNHDNIGHNQSFNVVNSCTIQHGRYQFYCEHQPVGSNIWSIHGHSHNNDLTNYPFINPSRKTVNVSADLLDFKPIPLDELVRHVERNEFLEARESANDI